MTLEGSKLSLTSIECLDCVLQQHRYIEDILHMFDAIVDKLQHVTNALTK